MQPIQSFDTKPRDERDSDRVTDFNEGPSWGALAVAIVILALIVVSALVIGGNSDTADVPPEPVPNEAPIEPTP
jgi:hypothetical protein